MIAQKKVEPAVSLKTRNVVELFQERVRTSGNRRAAMYKVAGTWKDISWNELSERTRRLGAALISHGVQPGDRVVIFASTRLEWVIAHFANLSVGAVTVPIYASNTVDECAYIVKDAGAKLAFVDNDATEKGAAGRLTRLLEVQKKNPALASLIAFDKGALAGKAGVLALDDLEKEGQAQLDKVATDLDKRIADVHPDSPATIIYTSGTTGNPKGVVLTHRSWVYEGQVVGEIGMMVPDEAGPVVPPAGPLLWDLSSSRPGCGLGFSMAFCDNVDRLIEYAGEVRPTVLPAVPRIFEKVYAAVVQKAMAQPGIKGKLVHWAFREFDKYAAAREAGKDYTALSFQLAKALVFKKMGQQVKDRVGGNIPSSSPGRRRWPRNRLLLRHQRDHDPRGIWPHRDLRRVGDQSPRQQQDRDGGLRLPWHRAEDRGGRRDPHPRARGDERLLQQPRGHQGVPHRRRVAEDRRHRRARRRGLPQDHRPQEDIDQDLGRKVRRTPEPRERAQDQPHHQPGDIHGDRRKFISALVTISEDEGKKVLKEKGIPYTTYPEMTQRPEVKAEVQKAFDALNATLPSYETVKKFAILETDFTLEWAT